MIEVPGFGVEFYKSVGPLEGKAGQARTRAGWIVSKVKPANALDVGTGYGYLVKELNSLGVPTIGVDFNPFILQWWHENDPLLLADICNLPFRDGAFDLSIAMDVFQHIPGLVLETAVSEMKRVTGRVLWLNHHTGDKEILEKHLRDGKSISDWLPTRKEWMEILKPEFSVVEEPLPETFTVPLCFFLAFRVSK